jgi:arylsulfate sulfotransferase
MSTARHAALTVLALGLASLACGPGSSESVGYDIAVDPYGTSPLVAVVNLRGIEASEALTIDVVVAGKDGAPDFTRTYSPTDAIVGGPLDTSDLTFPEPGTHVPILGLYADRENEVRIHVDRHDRDAVDLTLPIETHLSAAGEAAWVPTVRVNTAVSELMEPGWTVAELSIEPNPAPPIVFVDWTRYLAFDERGAVRWALRLDALPKGETFTLRRSVTGTFLTGSLDTIVEVTKLGRTTRSVHLPEHTLNHEILQIGSKDNCEGDAKGTTSAYVGNLLVLASKNGAATVQDHVLELDRETGAVRTDWDLATILDPTRTTFIDPEVWAPGAGDWLHDNGLAYSAVDESIIVSGRHQGVAKVRRDGTLVWLLAPHEGWKPPQSARLLTAVSASGAPYGEAVQLGNEAAGDPTAPEFDWPFGQHSPALLPNGDLLLFDNGTSRHWGPPYASFSRAVVYRIDEAAMTIRQVAELVLTRSESSYFISNTHQLPVTGNILIQPGVTPRRTAIVKEVATQLADDGTVAFDKVVFDAAVDLSWVDASRSFGYSYRGHRWTF